MRTVDKLKWYIIGSSQTIALQRRPQLIEKPEIVFAIVNEDLKGLGLPHVSKKEWNAVADFIGKQQKTFKNKQQLK